jgi:hypothetical protein
MTPSAKSRETVDAALKRVVAGEIIAGIEDYFPDMLIFNAKQNLGWKQRWEHHHSHTISCHLMHPPPPLPSHRVEELSQQVDQMSARCQEMEEVRVPHATPPSSIFSFTNFPQTEIILKDELEEMRKKESTMLFMRERIAR